MTKEPTHRFVGTHADHVAVGDCVVPVAPGDFVTLSANDEKSEDNAALFESGALVKVRGEK